jgi:hypothetical protein
MKEQAMVTIEIFDPPMCCPTGVCGPAIDPALLNLQEAVLKVRSEFDAEVRVDRYLLSQQPAKFTQQAEVLARLKGKGVEALPIPVVDGAAVKEAAYPTYAELRGWIERARGTVPEPTR